MFAATALQRQYSDDMTTQAGKQAHLAGLNALMDVPNGINTHKCSLMHRVTALQHW